MLTLVGMTRELVSQPVRGEGHRAGEEGFRRAALAMFAAGLTTFALLNVPQPLLPLLSRSFHVSPTASTLTLITPRATFDDGWIAPTGAKSAPLASAPSGRIRLRVEVADQTWREHRRVERGTARRVGLRIERLRRRCGHGPRSADHGDGERTRRTARETDREHDVNPHLSV